MSWLGSVRPNAKIHQRNEYYYFTPERIQKGFFKLYSAEQISIISDEIKRPPPPTPGRNTVVKVIPRDMIVKLNVSNDFIFKTRLTVGKTSYIFGEFPLGDVLTINNFGYPDLISHAFLSSGEHCLDLGDQLVILPMTMSNPLRKFKDPKIIEKLTLALHGAIDKVASGTWPEFTIENNEENPEKKIQLKVSVSLSASARERFTGRDTGRFKLPDLPLPEISEEIKQ